MPDGLIQYKCFVHPLQRKKNTGSKSKDMFLTPYWSTSKKIQLQGCSLTSETVGAVYVCAYVTPTVTSHFFRGI
jgi:hypothetical protein